MNLSFRSARIIALFACVAVAGISAGCRKPPPNPVQNKKFVGVWVEYDGPARSLSGQAQIIQTGTDRRYLELSADNTFKFAITNKNGTPLTPPQTSSGTWKLDEAGTRIIFEHTAMKLDARYADSRPYEVARIELKESGAKDDALWANAEDGRPTQYVRKN